MLRKAFPIRQIVVTAAIVVTIGIVWSAPVRDQWIWIDVRSGSIKLQTEWLFGIKTTEVIQHSSLERWIREHGRNHEYQWQTLAITSETLFGRPVVFACGMAPPIYQLRPLMNDFVATANEDEIGQLVGALGSDSEQEQEQAVNLAATKLMATVTPNLRSQEDNDANDR